MRRRHKRQGAGPTVGRGRQGRHPLARPRHVAAAQAWRWGLHTGAASPHPEPGERCRAAPASGEPWQSEPELGPGPPNPRGAIMYPIARQSVPMTNPRPSETVDERRSSCRLLHGRAVRQADTGQLARRRGCAARCCPSRARGEGSSGRLQGGWLVQSFLGRLLANDCQRSFGGWNGQRMAHAALPQPNGHAPRQPRSGGWLLGRVSARPGSRASAGHTRAAGRPA